MSDNVTVTLQPNNVTVNTATNSVTIGNQVPNVNISTSVQSLTITNQQPNVTIAAVGPQGPQGPSGSSAVFYVHTQATPSATWTINHNLQGNPTAVVMDSAGTMCEGSFSYPTSNQMLINFSSAFSGTSYIIQEF